MIGVGQSIVGGGRVAYYDAATCGERVADGKVSAGRRGVTHGDGGRGIAGRADDDAAMSGGRAVARGGWVADDDAAIGDGRVVDSRLSVGGQGVTVAGEGWVTVGGGAVFDGKVPGLVAEAYVVEDIGMVKII